MLQLPMTFSSYQFATILWFMLLLLLLLLLLFPAAAFAAALSWILLQLQLPAVLCLSLVMAVGCWLWDEGRTVDLLASPGLGDSQLLSQQHITALKMTRYSHPVPEPAGTQFD
jgi:hypothetical protein